MPRRSSLTLLFVSLLSMTRAGAAEPPSVHCAHALVNARGSRGPFTLPSPAAHLLENLATACALDFPSLARAAHTGARLTRWERSRVLGTAAAAELGPRCRLTEWKKPATSLDPSCLAGLPPMAPEVLMDADAGTLLLTSALQRHLQDVRGVEGLPIVFASLMLASALEGNAERMSAANSHAR